MFHDFVDDVFRRALVDDKPKVLLDTLHATNRDLIPDYIQYHQYLIVTTQCHQQQARSLSGRRCVKSYLRSPMGDTRLFNLYTDMCKSTWI